MILLSPDALLFQALLLLFPHHCFLFFYRLLIQLHAHPVLLDEGADTFVVRRACNTSIGGEQKIISGIQFICGGLCGDKRIQQLIQILLVIVGYFLLIFTEYLRKILSRGDAVMVRVIESRTVVDSVCHGHDAIGRTGQSAIPLIPHQAGSAEQPVHLPHIAAAIKRQLHEHRHVGVGLGPVFILSIFLPVALIHINKLLIRLGSQLMQHFLVRKDRAAFRHRHRHLHQRLPLHIGVQERLKLISGHFHRPITEDFSRHGHEVVGDAGQVDFLFCFAVVYIVAVLIKNEALRHKEKLVKPRSRRRIFHHGLRQHIQRCLRFLVKNAVCNTVIVVNASDPGAFRAAFGNIEANPGIRSFVQNFYRLIQCAES